MKPIWFYLTTVNQLTFSIYFYISSFIHILFPLLIFQYILLQLSSILKVSFYPFSIFSYRIYFLYYFPISHNKSYQLTINQVTFSFYFHLCSFDFPMNSIATIVNSEDKPFYPFPYFPTGSNFPYFPYYFPISILSFPTFPNFPYYEIFSQLG